METLFIIIEYLIRGVGLIQLADKWFQHEKIEEAISEQNKVAALSDPALDELVQHDIIRK